MIDRLRNEPVLVVALLDSLIALGIAFGLSLSAEQIAAILAPLQIILGLGARQLVTPVVRNLEAPETLAMSSPDD